MSDDISGDITYEDVISVVIWKDFVARVVVTGRTILNMLERSVNNPKAPRLWGGFLQYSGMQQNRGYMSLLEKIQNITIELWSHLVDVLELFLIMGFKG